MHTRLLLTPLLTILLITNSCMSDKKADLILFNGTIYTVDESFSKAEAMAVRDRMILAVGSTNDILKQYDTEKSIDLEGKFVYPGLIDAHCHFLGYGNSLLHADLVGTTSFEEIVDLVKKRQEDYPSEWVLGRGWDQNDWEVKEFPTLDLLDEVFPDNPVLLRRIDGHAAIANSVALKMAGVNENTAVEGGSLMTRNGKLTGVLVDNAIGLIGRIVPDPHEDEVIAALLKGEAHCFAVGLTSVHDAGLGYETINLIDSLHKSGELKMRVYAMLSPGEKNYVQYMYKGIHKTDRLNVRSVKLYADGALGSRGALMLEPYSDDPGNVGLAVSSVEYLREQCRLAYENGYQANIHCIGDSANRLALDLYAEFLKGNNDRRWRIEHAQIIHPEDFSKFGKYSIIPSVQSTHGTSDMYWADERVGDERIKGAYAFRQLMEENGWIPNGSDFPVENINPLYGYYAMSIRKDLDGYPEEGFQVENALTREEAFKAMTIWAAMSAFEENEKGSLETGKLADFIITQKDLLIIPAEQIPTTRIVETWIGGEKVYSR
ncbi:MAG TPA: amidohydrolase [Bacteroides sp.]|nr:amidohydrolase [Bacteroides sp.]